MIINGNWDTRQVWIDEVELDPAESQKVYNHSPDGFNWGYGGSGPAQLALALLIFFTDKKWARAHYQQFKWDIIAKLPQRDFEIEEEVITNWVFNAWLLEETNKDLKDLVVNERG